MSILLSISEASKILWDGEFAMSLVFVKLLDKVKLTLKEYSAFKIKLWRLNYVVRNA
mgnify:CR=1 FL=1